MMPVYGRMDSHSHQRYQMPFSHYHYPGVETIPPYMKMDPSKHPFTPEQPWRYAGNYAILNPWNSCCGHNNLPGYFAYRHACPYPSPSPIYCSGGCPSYPEVYSVPYTMPSHYSMELPRYEFDKSINSNYHCCGCPNHICNQKEGESLKIEEQKPDFEEKESGSLVPVQWKNCPYPIIFSPPECMNMEQRNNVKSDEKPNGYFGANEKDPGVLNGWFPLDTKSIPGVTQNGEKKATQNQAGEDKERGFPFPVFWMPYYDNVQEAGLANNTERNDTVKSAKEAPHTLKFIPINLSDGDADANEARSNEERSETKGGTNVEEETNNKKSNPVKQMEMIEEKNESEGTEKKRRNIPVKQIEENMTYKHSQTNAKRQSSPKKTSKLPPVCLRVDPLPRKKPSNSSLRSPSPTASKEHSQRMSNETSKVYASSGMIEKSQQESQLQNTSSNNMKTEPKEKTIEVLDMRTSGNQGADHGDVSESQMSSTLPNGEHGNDSEMPRIEEIKKYGDECNIQEKEAERKAEHNAADKDGEAKVDIGSTKPATTEGEQKRKTISEGEAAILIQSAYRGFEVRRCEPLKKLKQMAEVREQMVDVRNRIQALDACIEIQRDDKQKVTIGETIMRLLLKLDTIQGLIPSFREVRKSLARELVSLQEKLDSIVAKKSNEQIHNAQSIGCIDGQQGEKEAVLEKKSYECVCHDCDGDKMLEPCQSEFYATDALCSSKDDESESVLCRRPDHGHREPPMVDALESSVEPDPFVLNLGDASGVMVMDTHCSNTDPRENSDTVAEGETKFEIGGTLHTDNLDASSWEELPLVVIDDEFVAFDSGRDLQADIGKNESRLSKVSNMGPDINLLAKDDDLLLDMEQRERDPQDELPAGLLDEDYAIPKSKKHEEVENEILEGEQEECGMPIAGEISNETQVEQHAQGVEEVQSNEESDSWINVECQKDQGLFGDSSHDVEVEQLLGVEVRDDNEFSTVTECPASQRMSLPVDHDACSGEISIQSQLNEVQGRQVEHRHLQPLSGNTVDDQSSGTEPGEDETLTGRQPSPLPEVNEKEMLVASSVLGKSANTEHDDGFDRKKLIEENKKLRELIEKLIEAGNDQLTVISNLTGRVKDLEKKLSRRKNMRMKHCRPETKRHCIKSINN
ncbi:BAG family molecular chaperone regulator 6 [Quillaja saponaria]|uniref:BAG family molecular chaperone regulator 6 n=1 Tax=Quillaja saponaria TaxID=32244 RepID=A0AAD7L496_QUISA|nr:BAG family molecular chaperone regulator 6 [Quillaja saponaria]